MAKEVKTFSKFLRDKITDPNLEMDSTKLLLFADKIETAKIPENMPLLLSYLERQQDFNDKDLKLFQAYYLNWIDQEQKSIYEKVKEERGEI